jgi:hypothetical protein
MPGIYSYNSPHKLFEKLKRDFIEFFNNPSEDGLLTVLFSLYHLREWICPGKEIYKSIALKSEADRTSEERLYMNMYSMPEYKIVCSLCNHAKHFKNKGLDGRTDALHGARAGMARAGDSLGITHFTVDGIEVRDIFCTVYKKYLEYFE